uniref:Uncharacterized protein n=1 Tax=Kwoniella dejecticola CBS 10117 TaxID=1296121 RepID=A0A1A6A692_9TREE|nr:uncharacterized protein I303_04913 [Kwoniella dejecticola CBS 10117]OBR85577.1 hypothetical protein I303_04913 [Kwoniella dejecticola CBS 10117]
MFKQYQDLPESTRRLTVDQVKAPYFDVDKWEISLSPNEYLRRFNDALAMVQLASHTPKMKPGDNASHNYDFSNWLLLANSTHQLWVHPSIKEPFITELKRTQVVQLADHPLQATNGTVLVPVVVFVTCLKKAGCETLYLKAYGQKLPLAEPYLTNEPAQADHKFSKFNQWDIGKNFNSSLIWLFQSVNPLGKEASIYPMIIPGSLDYGSFNLKVTYNSKIYTIKIYPQLVHVIKSYNSKLQRNVAKTVAGIKKNSNMALQLIQQLSKTPTYEIGGFRIEVTITARTLTEARAEANDLPFYNVNFWLQPPPGDFERYQLKAIICNKTALLDNANWVFQQASTTGFFKGRNADTASPAQLQAIILLSGPI